MADSFSGMSGGCLWWLTFDMSGSHKWAKPACDCPFDGRVRARWKGHRRPAKVHTLSPPELQVNDEHGLLAAGDSGVTWVGVATADYGST